MILKRLKVENLGPFLGDWEISLPLGVSAFVGEYEEAEARSNRAGKSYLAVDAPLYALFGYHRAARVEDLPHRLARGNEPAFAELEIDSSDGRDWFLRRGRTVGGDPIRELNGSSISERDLERVVRKEIVGLSQEEYLLTMGAVQGEMHAFMKMGAAEKRRIVSPWFATDRWVPRADLARKRLGRAQSELRALESEERRLRERLEDLPEVEKRVRTAEKERESVSEGLRKLREERERLLAREEGRRERGARRSTLEREERRLSADLETERDAAERERRAAARILEDAERELSLARDRAERVQTFEAREKALEQIRALVSETAASAREAREELRKRTSAREELRSKFKDLEKSRTGTCPVLLRPCDRVERDEELLSGIKVEGLGHRRAILRLEADLKNLDWKLGMAEGDLADAEKEVGELRKIRGLPTVAQAEADYEAARREAGKAEKAVERVKLGRTETAKALHRTRRELEALPARESGGEEEIADLAKRIEVAEIQLESFEESLLGAKADLAVFGKDSKRLEEIPAERGKLVERVELLAFASYAFGAAGIPSRELENAFGVAEDEMNRVLAELSTPLRVGFAPTRELKDWEPACLGCGASFAKGERSHVCSVCGAPRRRRRRDELRLEVEDGGNVASFEQDSGGGKILLSLGVRLGFAALPGARRAVRCESLLIDEPDGALDEPNRAALHALLRGGLERLGIRQTLLITHADVRREFRSVVTVHRWESEDRSGAWND